MIHKMAFRPILPPKDGYVEVLDPSTNKHVYRKIRNEQDDRITTLESENDLLKQQLKAASDQNDFLEDCIAEMAAIVYA